MMDTWIYPFNRSVIRSTIVGVRDLCAYLVVSFLLPFQQLHMIENVYGVSCADSVRRILIRRDCYPFP